MKQGISRRKFSLGSAAALLSANTMSQGIAAPQAGVVLVDGNKPLVVVIPDAPRRSVVYAAQELTVHLEKATGTRPKIVSESMASAESLSDAFIFLGETTFARSSGIELNGLAPEASIIRTIGKNLLIVGLDAPGDPLASDTRAGTLFGVYEFLERYLGVRWLWPGELGTVVPKTTSLLVPRTDEVVAPRLMQRHVRIFKLKNRGHPELGFSSAAAADYRLAERVFLRRHRMGRRHRMSYGHAFRTWWEKYGEQHPEWFQLVGGRRGPAKKDGHFSMSIADPGLHEKIIALWREKGGARMGPSFINAVENDTPGLCECSLCRALDSPPPPDYLKFISPRSTMARTRFVTDRYARSWLEIQRVAARENPDVTVVGYAYFNYFVPPTSGVRLNKNILIGFCPSSWFYPRTSGVQEWMKKQWRGWADTGAQLFMRVNYFLDGYCMPYIFAHQFADDFRNASHNALVGTDFDSLTGHWATQGPTLYLLMRLQIHPSDDPDNLLDEFYAAFGPASADVEVYFRHWEAYTMGLSGSLDETFEDLHASRWRSWAKAANAVYPESCFAKGERLLAKAEAAASNDTEARERVRFLKLGLEHAKLCSRAARELSLSGEMSGSKNSKRALEALVEFRQNHERTWISNFDHCAWVEGQSWRLS